MLVPLYKFICLLVANMSFQKFQGYDEIEFELFCNDSSHTRENCDHGVHRATPVSSASKEEVGEIFKTTQTGGSSAFREHPAIRMVIEWIKASYTLRLWDGKPVNEHIFDSIDYSSFPGVFSVPNIDNDRIERGGVGLLIKALYNGCPDYRKNINMDKCTHTVEDLNKHIWEQKIPFLVEYYRCNYGVRPSNSLVQAYKSLLCSKAYKMLKQKQATDGNWRDPNLEMFNHFVKLVACGASDAQLEDVYNALTQTEPKLDGSSYAEIYPGHWRKYEGWIASGNLDYRDLEAQQLDEMIEFPTFPMNALGRPIFITLADKVVRGYGYQKAS